MSLSRALAFSESLSAASSVALGARPRAQRGMSTALPSLPTCCRDSSPPRYRRLSPAASSIILMMIALAPRNRPPAP